jgi:hypothetical protein
MKALGSFFKGLKGSGTSSGGLFSGGVSFKLLKPLGFHEIKENLQSLRGQRAQGDDVRTFKHER